MNFTLLQNGIVSFYINIDRFISDIDQLTRILVLCGTPTEDTLNKITSEEVSFFSIYRV